MSMLSPKADKWVGRMTWVVTITASYFLITADYGPHPNALDPIKKALLSGEQSVKEFFLRSKKGAQEAKKPTSDATSEKQS